MHAYYAAFLSLKGSWCFDRKFWGFSWIEIVENYAKFINYFFQSSTQNLSENTKKNILTIRKRDTQKSISQTTTLKLFDSKYLCGEVLSDVCVFDGKLYSKFNQENVYVKTCNEHSFDVLPVYPFEVLKKISDKISSEDFPSSNRTLIVLQSTSLHNLYHFASAFVPILVNFYRLKLRKNETDVAR